MWDVITNINDVSNSGCWEVCASVSIIQVYISTIVFDHD